MTGRGSDEAAWRAVAERLAGTLDGLDDGGFVVLGEPEPAPPARRLRFGGRRAEAPGSRYVQVLRQGEWLQAECVGARLFGGAWELSAEQHDEIRALGWLAPGDADDLGTQPAYPNYWRTLPDSQRADVVALAVGALRVLGTRPEDLVWRQGP